MVNVANIQVDHVPPTLHLKVRKWKNCLNKDRQYSYQSKRNRVNLMEKKEVGSSEEISCIIGRRWISVMRSMVDRVEIVPSMYKILSPLSTSALPLVALHPVLDPCARHQLSETRGPPRLATSQDGQMLIWDQNTYHNPGYDPPNSDWPKKFDLSSHP